jgi:ATP-dependent helicase HepA
MWSPGDRVRHRFNEDLGPGRILEVEARQLVVEFPRAGTTMRLAAGTDALTRLVLRPGARARLDRTGERVLVEAVHDDGSLRLADGREVAEDELWPLDAADSPAERLAEGRIDPVEHFALRLDALHLARVREADGLGSFLGGRIRIFPHQFWVAERATRADPVRWLLADEVGLGKTVEACLILNHLVRARRVDRVLVVAPGTLTVQWLGELWRKYHQVFVLLDDARLADVARDHGAGFNPFDAHRRTVVSIEQMIRLPRLVDQAAEAGIDLLVVDEAHHLQRPPGHPGNPEYRAVAPLCGLGRHVLLLTATPLEDDAHGFFRLLQLLRPEEFPEDAGFEERLRRGEPLPPCTSSTRREDIGGLPPRTGDPVEIDDAGGFGDLLALERAARALPAPHAALAREKARRVAAALESGSALAALLRRDEDDLRELARRADRHDPRLEWLARRGAEWKKRGEKTLVFVHRRESLETLRAALSHRAQLATAVFHEDLSAADRDLQVAQFRRPEGPSILVSTECGGEGRNFEFCRRIVLFDLPWNPVAVEQRIGRLDRIGRTRPVEIVRFRPPSGLGRSVADLYERLGAFREPLGGVERELAPVEAAIAAAASDGLDTLPEDLLDSLVRRARIALDREREAAYHELHREPFRAERGPEILSRVPEDLDELTQDVILEASEMLGLHVEPHRDGAHWSVEFGNRARVDSLPGVPGGATFVGTFDRETAVEDESLDYFASGHPFVEGILAELEDGPWGRTTLLRFDAEGPGGFGLAAVYKEGPEFEVVVVDASGTRRPEWAAMLSRRPLRTRRVKAEAWTSRPEWAGTIRAMATRLDPRRRPLAVAAVLVGG